jgi:hypothetical protein
MCTVIKPLMTLYHLQYTGHVLLVVRVSTILPCFGYHCTLQINLLYESI